MALSAGTNSGFSLMKPKDSFLGRDRNSGSDQTFDVLPQRGNSVGILIQRDGKPYIHTKYNGEFSDGCGEISP